MRASQITCLAWLCALLATGCGGGGEGSARTRSAAAHGFVTIARPSDGRRIHARETKRGAWIAKLAVRGSAAPNSTVHLRGGCRPKPCLAQTRADAGGAWSARLPVRTLPSVRFVTVDAGPDKMFAKGSSVVTVELYGPRRTVTAQAGPSAPRENRASKPPPPRTLPRDVLVIGDSLAVGMAPALKADLRGWNVRVDARIGRPLAAGMKILAQRSSAPAIVAFSLFTNNDPRGSGQLEQAVRASAARPGGCAVWATIVAPPVNGVGYAAVNRMLGGLARESQLALSLQVVDWARAVAADHSLLAGDHVHGTAAGYATLARLYADAIRACAGEQLG
jgi:hypothetical protein